MSEAVTQTKPLQHHTTLRLANAPVGRLLWEYAIPAIVGTMVMSLYNIIDRIFIGQGVGPYAISGLALTFPIMSLAGAIGMLVGVGGSTRISIELGRSDKHRAEKVLGNSLVLILIFALVYSSCFFIFMRPILESFGGSERTIPYAAEYLTALIPGMVLINISYGFNNMMRSSGYPKQAMYCMLVGAACNVVLDPIFIFVLDMGIQGAAIATDISMAISAFLVLSHFMRPTSFVRFRRTSFKLEKSIVRSIIAIGLSPFIINVAASGVNVILNTSLQNYGGDIAIGAAGIVNSIATLIVMMIVGLCLGMQPIVGFNYGSGNTCRMKRAYLLTVKVATVITSVGFFASALFPEWIARAFTGDEALVKLSTHALRIALMAFPVVGFQIVTTNFFQSIGMASRSIFLSLARQVLFLIPLLLLLPPLWDTDGIWFAMPMSDTITSIITLILLYHHRHIFHGAKLSH